MCHREFLVKNINHIVKIICDLQMVACMIFVLLFGEQNHDGGEERQRMLIAIGGGNSIMLPTQENQAKFHAAFADGDFEFVSTISSLLITLFYSLFIIK